jgi:hypothetical protein
MATVKPDAIMKQIAGVAYPDYNGRKFRVQIAQSPLDVRSYWEGGSRSYYVFVDMRDLSHMRVMDVPQQSAFDKAIPNADRVTIPTGFVCVQHTIFQGHDLGLTFHVSPADAPKMLESADRPDLNDLESAFIRLWGGLTSAGRKDERSRQHIPQWLIDCLTSDLADKGLMSVNRAGAVSLTLAGTQYREAFGHSQDYMSFWYQWAGSWRMSDVDYRYRAAEDTLARQWLDVYLPRKPRPQA